MKAWSNQKKKKNSRQRSENIETQETQVHQHVKSNDLFYTLVPIDYVSKTCGLLPVKLTQNKLDHKFHGEADFPLLAYGLILALTLAGAQCWGLRRDTRDGMENSTRLFSRTAVVVTSSDIFLVISVTAFAIVGSSTRWKHILQALDLVVQADEKLNFTTTKNLRKSSIILIACSLTYLIGISALDYISWDILVAIKNKGEYKDKGPINYSPLYFMYAVIVSLHLQYAIILMNLGERFAELNSTIESLTKANVIIDYFRKDLGLAAQEPRRRETSRTFASPDRNRQRRFNGAADANEGAIYENFPVEQIDQLISVHGILCDSIIHVNKAFGAQLLMCTLSCLIHLVITSYFLFAEFTSANSRWYVFVRQICWIIFHIYKMVLFVQPAFAVASKARNTGSLVSQALACNWNPQAQKQLERFTMQLLHRPVEFTACGLFCLDRGLMTSIAGAVTTYLVILVQFQNNDDNETRALLLNASLLLRNVSRIGDS